MATRMILETGDDPELTDWHREVTRFLLGLADSVAESGRTKEQWLTWCAGAWELAEVKRNRVPR